MKYFLALCFVIFMIAPSLNPLADGMFSFHDPTQVGRIHSFTQNLRLLHIPPRLAPEFSFGLGFGVFNFYAPSAYWISSVFALMGFSSTFSLKLSFFFALMVAFSGMYLCLAQLFSEPKNKKTLGPLIGACVYVSSTYFATEIMVRGNLAETWFLALFPLTIGLLIFYDNTQRRGVFVLATLTMALLFTAHNVLSLFSIAFLLVFCFFSSSRQKLLLSFTLALCLDASFFIPAFWEGNLVQAARIAHEYPYAEHFLCPWQLWSAPRWEFGGSLPGCETDTMSFKLGKVQVVFAILGLCFFVIDLLRNRKKTLVHQRLFLIALLSVCSFFLTLEYSAFIWQLGSAVMAIFQFPWRFIGLGLIGLGVFSGYLFHRVNLPFSFVVFVFVCALLFLPARKYFIKPLYTFDEYEKQFNSPSYLRNELAYKMKEYLVSTADYATWNTFNPDQIHQLESGINSSTCVSFSGRFTVLECTSYQKKMLFEQEGVATVQIHYFPFWIIKRNAERVIPDRFDALGRPVISVARDDILSISFQQTPIEYLANAISILTLVVLVIVYKRLPS